MKIARGLLLLVVTTTALAQERMLWEHDSETTQGTKPIRVSRCELFRNPLEYAGKIVEFRAYLFGGNLKDGAGLRITSPIGVSDREVCNDSYISIVAVSADVVEPKPDFEITRDESFEFLRHALEDKMEVDVTLRGRFDVVFAHHDKKRVRISKGSGFGRKQDYDARLAIQSVADVYSFRVIL